MHFLCSALSENEDCKKLLHSLDMGFLPAVCTGLPPVCRAAVIATAAQNGHRVSVICPDEAEATRLCEDIISLGTEARLLPARDLLPERGVINSKEWEHKRLYTLSALADGVLPVCVGSAESFSLITLPPERLTRSTFKIKSGDLISPIELCERLLSAGYTRCEQVEGPGQFASRGGILDVFPTGLSSPVRIEFWGDEIDTVCFFDPESQRRGDTADEVFIAPAREALADKRELLEILARLGKKKLTDEQKKTLEYDRVAIESDTFSEYDRYLPYLYDGRYTAFDYIGDGVLFICDSAAENEKLSNLLTLHGEDIKRRLESGTAFSNDICYLSRGEFWQKAEKKSAVILENFTRSGYEIPLRELIPFEMKQLPPWRGGLELLLEDISENTVILAGNEKSGRLLCEELSENGKSATFMENPSGGVRGIIVTVGGLSAGISVPRDKFTLITHSDILKQRRRTVKKRGNSINSLDELHGGEYVVHAVHGIGQFMGVHKIENNGIIKDYLKIIYAKGDVLYVPVTQLDLVSKYIGGDEGIRLNKLGGTEWQKTRTRVRTAVRDMAKQLTALYAKRLEIKGHAFSADTDIQSDFERRFEFEETEDQLRCINEIKDDMEKAVPMDRLLCGDVGFGKTEVALRAAFKCVSEGKQCAFMAPTTILAWQHYNTVLRRFGDFPLETRLLSRFVSKSNQQKTVTELARGSVDMVIGTHRLISSDIKFHDLGLIIIDEEQRFGVAQKEKLKELYPNVDVLTLSATPIPRTLNMAMTGLRDMSSIDEAPEDRQPVQTYVLEQQNGLLLDAIHRELRRGGQVYYLHNRVESITACAARLKAQLPDANIGIAHGKMDEETLSRVWKQLLEHEIDILVCTTIIETGVDVPNANTLIIEDADRMGLSQLHQLRGRVGRSPRRAYAYFCFRPGKALSEIAEKRLDAIREYTEFGSGFKIAMRDLEIRGAGSILGGEQHGHLEAVGYDMYVQLLSDAIKEEKGEAVEKENNCVIDLQISAHIPESYIAVLPQRLYMYRRIAEIKTEEDKLDVIDELCDRFGEPPRTVLGLLDIALLRSRAFAHGITEVSQSGSVIRLYSDTISQEVSARLSEHFSLRFMIGGGKRPHYAIEMAPGQNSTAALREIMDTIAADKN
ncbi:MAG: transcription-repair coupling factor [Clostridia bacterium]|nr:transcription-repair coupling factor [Clostridia bacterium]